jgi:hypothetical protein
MRNRIIERPANDLFDKLFAQAVRVFVRRQEYFPIHK